MNRINWRRTWMSRILLAVFVPMLMLSTFHIHTEGFGDDIGCSECMHHVRHSHLSTADFCIGQCVLCQFQTLPFIAASLTAVIIPLMAHRLFVRNVRQVIPVHTAAVISLRAPPYLM